MQNLDQAFKNKKISIRLHNSTGDGADALHGTCLRVTGAGLLLKPESTEDIFVPSEKIELFWISQ